MNMLQAIENSILVIRDVPVILDSDVATFYGVETKHVNQAIKNNPDKFPDGYVISVEKEEKNELVKNFDRFNSLKHSTAPVKGFTEKGLWMLSTILKSPKATETTLVIIEAFAKIRELGRNIRELADETSKADKKQLMQRTGEIISDMLSDDLETLETESSFELNLAMVKFKHTTKKVKKPKSKK